MFLWGLGFLEDDDPPVNCFFLIDLFVLVVLVARDAMH